MAELQRLRADHAAAVLAFELANRAWFATSISDRGDEYFDEFDDRFQWLLEDQAAGNGAYYVLVADGGSVIGRFNLIIDDGTAVLGYRVAEHVAGRGVATTYVGELCRLAQGHGIHTLVAAVATTNLASRRVLEKVGFVPERPADPSEIGGKEGTAYRLDLGDLS